MIGVDLGTKNLAIYYSHINEYQLYSEDMFKNFGTFAVFIADTLNHYNQPVFVDFHINEIHLPGKRLVQAKKYYIAGALDALTETCFVSPKQIREMLGFPASVPKKEIHRTAKIVYPELQLVDNQHFIDAFLLVKWGEKNYGQS